MEPRRLKLTGSKSLIGHRCTLIHREGLADHSYICAGQWKALDSPTGRCFIYNASGKAPSPVAGDDLVFGTESGITDS